MSLFYNTEVKDKGGTLETNFGTIITCYHAKMVKATIRLGTTLSKCVTSLLLEKLGFYFVFSGVDPLHLKAENGRGGLFSSFCANLDLHPCMENAMMALITMNRTELYTQK